jgi:hypothetical protein
MYSTPVCESDIWSQVNSLNAEFLADRIEFIKETMLHLTKRDNLTNNNTFAVHDDRAAKASSIIAKQPRQVVNDRHSDMVNLERGGKRDKKSILNEWRYAQRGRLLRDDVPGDSSRDSVLVHPGKNIDNTTGERASVMIGDGYHFRGGSGETDCRDSDMFHLESPQENTNYALETMINDPKVQLLNRRTCKYGEYDSMPEANIRLWNSPWSFVDESDQSETKRYMERRVFRTWNGKHGDNVIDQLPPWQVWIHRRHVDMKDTVSMDGNVERGNHIRGYDMSQLKCRVDANRCQYQDASYKPFRMACDDPY